MPGKHRTEARKSDFGNQKDFLEGRCDISSEAWQIRRKQPNVGAGVGRACFGDKENVS